MSRYTILVDMDEVLANFSKTFGVEYISKFCQTRSSRQVVSWPERKHWKVRDDYPEKYRADIDSIYDRVGFYKTLETMQGAKSAIIALKKKYNIYIVTSLRKENLTCYEDKAWWLETHIGTDFSRLMIPCSDKTIIWGHMLIDDNPNPRLGGANPHPYWTHIVFDQPWNRDVKGPRIKNNWSNAEEVIEKVLKDRERREMIKCRGFGDYDDDIVDAVFFG